jgi:hypothetical protein
MEAFLTFLSIVGTLGILSFIGRWITDVTVPRVDAALEKRKIEKQLEDAQKAIAEEAAAARKRLQEEKKRRDEQRPVDVANEIIGSKD